MKKFTEKDIVMIHSTNNIDAMEFILEAVMRNQNDIIEKLEEINQKIEFHFPEEE